MEKNDLVRVFLRGGVVSPGDMKRILETAEDFGNEFIHFGSRQDLLFPVNIRSKTILDHTFQAIRTEYDFEGNSFQNIVSSYVAADILPSTNWLHSDTYLYILDDFEQYRTQLKINIADPRQTLVPLFTGNLNFVASKQDNYWYLYLSLPEYGEELVCWPVLIYTFDVVRTVKALEEVYLAQPNLPVQELYEQTSAKIKANNRPVDEELELPKMPFPSYEGMNKMAGDKYWLGLYWRNNCYTIKFLKALCNLCVETNIGKISITPWKSFIIKGIQEKDKIKYEKLLGKHGINMRHSSLELNWHLPVLDEEAFQLKRYLVRTFDQNDISTEGLTFAVKTVPMVLFTSIVIEKNPVSRYADKYDLLDTYNVMYCKDFNPNKREYISYAKDVMKEDLAPLLMELSCLYYEQLNYEPEVRYAKPAVETKPVKPIYQCSQCLTVYDETYGDALAGIEPGVPFANLPETYTCSLCDAPKQEYKPVAKAVTTAVA
ncbi:rubredoxin [Adhaeribacter aquaticus]|uniref:rubredoxin n=1 Tax=Adhaeribacter aquaticus TaxID=299567 RepID=UPI000426713C|nr:rubredoxin [Adhaeribacter aquaticus]